MSLTRHLASLLLALVALTACGESDLGDEAENAAGSVVALYANSSYGYQDDLAGHVLLVDAEGQLEVVGTEGIYFGSVSKMGTDIVVSDQSAEVFVSDDGIDRVERGQDFDAEWWSGVAAGWRWTFFNIGTRNTNTYYMGISATDGNAALSREVKGDVVGNTVCGDEVVAAIGKWSRPSAPHATRLVTFTTRSGEILGQTTTRLSLPSNSHVSNLACLNGRPLVLAMNRGSTFIGAPDLYGGYSWRTVPREVKFRGDASLIGVHSGELFSFSAYDGVIALNVRSLRDRKVLKFPEHQANSEVSFDGDRLVAWVHDNEGPSYFAWFDPATGDILRRVRGETVIEFLRESGEVVTRGPISLS